MPNSFTVFPNVIPGNVTIGGNLTVTGDQVRIGAASPFVRVGKDVGGSAMYSINMGFDTLTLDSSSIDGHDLALNQGNTESTWIKLRNGVGKISDAAVRTIFTDYTSHNHTGTTTEDTIYSKVIRGGIIGANGGLRLHLAVNFNIQGGVAAAIRIKLGSTILHVYSTTTAFRSLLELNIMNSSSGAQFIAGIVKNLSSSVLQSPVYSSSAVDTTVDQTFSVTIQSGAASDQQTLDMCALTLVNSFGPV